MILTLDLGHQPSPRRRCGTRTGWWPGRRSPWPPSTRRRGGSSRTRRQWWASVVAACAACGPGRRRRFGPVDGGGVHRAPARPSCSSTPAASRSARPSSGRTVGPRWRRRPGPALGGGDACRPHRGPARRRSVAAKVAWLAAHDRPTAGRQPLAPGPAGPGGLAAHRRRWPPIPTLASLTGLLRPRRPGGRRELAGPAVRPPGPVVPSDRVAGAARAGRRPSSGSAPGTPVVIGAGDRRARCSVPGRRPSAHGQLGDDGQRVAARWSPGRPGARRGWWLPRSAVGWVAAGGWPVGGRVLPGLAGPAVRPVRRPTLAGLAAPEPAGSTRGDRGPVARRRPGPVVAARGRGRVRRAVRVRARAGRPGPGRVRVGGPGRRRCLEAMDADSPRGPASDGLGLGGAGPRCRRGWRC